MPTANKDGNINLITKVIAFALALCAGTAVGTSKAQDGDTVREVVSSYRGCTGLASSDPQAAYEAAETWRVDGGGLPARHCEALALSGLGQHAEAARSLEDIAAAIRSGGAFEIGAETPARPRLIAELYAQAGNAWLLGEVPENALAAFSQGLIEAEAAPEALLELYIDRAHVAVAMAEFDFALGDIDRALARDPGRVEALLLRATALRALGRADEAGVALERALMNAPDNRRALLERAGLRATALDDAGAEADLRRILALYPGSDAAGAAIRMLESLLDARQRGVFTDQR